MTEKFIIPENKVSESEELSPSKKYKLVVVTYKTGTNTWNYTNGTLIRLNDNKVIHSFNRNYSTLSHSWFVRNEQEWFQSGTTYMSQLFVNLDAEEVYNDEQELKQTQQYKDGCNFCWVNSFVSPDGNCLCVSGCVWAGPYEYRFFDFSNPSNGWPELETDYSYDTQGEKAPHWNLDGTMTFYDSNQCIKYEDKIIDVNNDYETYKTISDEVLNNDDNYVWIEDQKRIVKRDENKMITVYLWKSDKRIKTEESSNKWWDEFDKKKQDVLNNNETYKFLVSEFKKKDYKVSHHFVGIQLEKLCITVSKEGKWIEVEWNIKEGPMSIKYSSSPLEQMDQTIDVCSIIVQKCCDYLN